jgi:hypothetical protein
MLGVGVAIEIGIEGARDGMRAGETGHRNRLVAVQAQLGSEV